MSVDIINEKRIKLVVNGGCLNPKGLAEKTHELVSEKELIFENGTNDDRSPPKAST